MLHLLSVVVPCLLLNERRGRLGKGEAFVVVKPGTIQEAIDALQNSGLAKSGYEYVLCDCKPCHCPTSLRLYLSK